MTPPEIPPERSHPARALLVLDHPRFHPLPFPAAGYTATRVIGWEALLGAVRRTAPSTAVLVSPFTGTSGDPDPRLRELLAAAPLLPVLVSLDLRSCAVSDVETLLGWGVSEVVDVCLEGGPEALVPRLEAAHARPFKRCLEAGVSRYVSANAVTLIRAAAEVACDCGLSPDLAARFGVNERTVGDWCGREGLPPPRRLLAWARVLLAAGLLGERGRSWANVARSTGYVDGRGLRRAITSFVPLAASPTRSQRPRFTDAIAAFESDLRRCREQCRSVNVRTNALQGTGGRP